MVFESTGEACCTHAHISYVLIQITGALSFLGGVKLTARLHLLCKYPVCFSDGNVWAVIGLFLYQADPFLLFACVQSLNKPVPSSDGATWHG